MHGHAHEVLALVEPGPLEKITLDVSVGAVEPWDWIEVAGQPERVESVTVLHNGRRIHFIRGARLTLPSGRMVRVTRRVRRGEISQTAPAEPPPDAPESRPS